MNRRKRNQQHRKRNRNPDIIIVEEQGDWCSYCGRTGTDPCPRCEADKEDGTLPEGGIDVHLEV